ncbi:gag-protease polyprotein [Cucumis melo var. makuwa]|uniref:Gag-protease polyprotein n=1 Tax=Cucumis melo var. makuwa TaxID=1194695 RepID=A0A5D3C758_CUCMM|nr:gag-protease polyprotein [Cucumis melo var. makuwa]
MFTEDQFCPRCSFRFIEDQRCSYEIIDCASSGTCQFRGTTLQAKVEVRVEASWQMTRSDPGVPLRYADLIGTVSCCPTDPASSYSSLSRISDCVKPTFVEVKHLRDFRKYNPKMFDGFMDDPTKAQMWLTSVETIFRYMKCPNDQKVQCAVFFLTNRGTAWWETAERMLGDVTVEQYDAEFDMLSPFSHDVVRNEATRTNKFVSGLILDLQGFVRTFKPITHADAMRLAVDMSLYERANPSQAAGKGSTPGQKRKAQLQPTIASQRNLRVIDFAIELESDTVPISRALYRIAPAKLKKLKIQLQELLDNGFIRPKVGHEKHFHQVLETLRANQLYAKCSKCYYRRFVEDFSRIASPLTQLFRKETPFVWSPACESSFKELKQKLVTTPV